VCQQHKENVHKSAVWFTIEDDYLVRCLSVSIKYAADHFSKMFPVRKWRFNGLKHFLEKMTSSGLGRGRLATAVNCIVVTALCIAANLLRKNT